MTDQISFPPLLDLSPTELQAHRQHLVSEISRQSERRRLSLTGLSPLRLRFALSALAAVCVAAVCAVVFSGALGGSVTHSTTSRSTWSSQHTNFRPSRAKSRPMGFMPTTLNFTRNGETVTSIAVTVNSSVPNATLQLQVLRTEDLKCPACSDAEHQVVFQEQVPMTNIASPSNGPSGVVALSTWSGNLSPSDWQGGCQNARYSVATEIVPAGSSFSSPAPGSNSGESEWFGCGGS